MIQQEFPSRLLENVVTELSKLPSVGRRTALRLALSLLKREERESKALGESIIQFRSNIKYCTRCHNICDTDLCDVCADTNRDGKTICVVENIADVMAIENTSQYHGLYHVLGGVISPMDGVGPNELEIASLIQRVDTEDVNEVLLALNPNMEGDTTAFYIYKKLAGANVRITTIARGISVGDSLEYADELTLGRSIVNRIDFAK
ncbi:MAG: recombination mediator RecR [Paludibacteraceae bacterium]|nr:recombination mediator RecR [Paludibacteraceae bacterium]